MTIPIWGFVTFVWLLALVAIAIYDSATAGPYGPGIFTMFVGALATMIYMGFWILKLSTGWL